MSGETALYPIALRLTGRPVLVVGGGAVAERKIGGLLAAGADVTIIAPVCCPAVAEWAERGAITLVARRYELGDADGYDLVFVAVDDLSASGMIQADARQIGAWVNAADDPAGSDFHLPAVARRGPLTVAVTTGGHSPTLARRLRDRLAAALTDEDVALAEALGATRHAQSASVGPHSDRPT